MFWLLLFSLCLEDEGKGGVVRYIETDVYQPVRFGEALASPEGHVYILNFDDAYINHFNFEGEKLDPIGGKGKGPGEFTYAVKIFFQGGKLYVFDLLNAQISVFQADGSFVKRFATPGRNVDIAKINGGWVYGDWRQFNLQGPATLRMVDENFENPKELLTLAEAGQSQGLWVMSSDDKVEARFSPINTYPKMVASPDGAKVYLTDSQKFRVTIIKPDGAMTVCERNDKRIPFDAEWADEQLAERKKANKHLPRIKTDYPEYFPAIRQFALAPDGSMVVDRWRGRPDDNHHLIAVNEAGEEQDMRYSWDLIERFVGTAKGHMFVTIYDPESELAGVARVPTAQAEAFVAKNPIEYDGSFSRSISISN